MQVRFPYGLILIFISLCLFYYHNQKRRIKREERRERRRRIEEEYLELLLNSKVKNETNNEEPIETN